MQKSKECTVISLSWWRSWLIRASSASGEWRLCRVVSADPHVMTWAKSVSGLTHALNGIETITKFPKRFQERPLAGSRSSSIYGSIIFENRRPDRPLRETITSRADVLTTSVYVHSNSILSNSNKMIYYLTKGYLTEFNELSHMR